MNIRDYLFIKKAKTSNKIKILDVLGFETDTTIIQTPDIIKEMDNLQASSAIEDINEENVSERFSQQLTYEITNNVTDEKIEEFKPEANTEIFTPLKVTSQIKKIWTDIEKRRQWLSPLIFVIATFFIISFVTVFFINNRNASIQNENITINVTKDANSFIDQIPDLIIIATDPFYSRYDISNASANLQKIESSLIEYESYLSGRDIEGTNEIEISLNSLYQVIQNLDLLFTYRIMHSDILIYEDTLTINQSIDVDDLTSVLSQIGAKSTLNAESLPEIDELNEHKKILESALITAQELHGRLVASLRNNEISVAETLISAIKLNKETETVFFNNSLLRLRSNYLEIVENVGKLP